MREAEAAFGEVAHQTPDGTPEKLIHLLNLALTQQERHRATGHDDARDAAVATFRTIAATSPTVAPDQGLAAARAWGHWATDRRDWAEAAEAYRAGLACLDLLYRRQGRRDQKETWLANAVGTTPGAAYALARTGNVDTAVVAAETGRAVILTEALDRITTDLNALAQAGHGQLAQEYSRAIEALAAADRMDDNPADDQSAPRPSVTDLRDAVDTLGTRIESVPGFEDFRRPPTFAAVAAAAGSTPVVYLLPTRAGGLALVVCDGRSEVVWLPDLTGAALSARVGSYLHAYSRQRLAPGRWRSVLRDLTEWLWPAVMAPVVTALADQEQAVLVPMGPLGLLPLHAAWRADPTAATGRRYALDDLLLTYAPNARSLAHARRVPTVTAADGILVVADPHPVRANPLRHAASEADSALELFSDRRRLDGPNATRPAVLAEISRWPVLHFACHAYADADQPLNSALLLANDERVSLGDLLRSDAFHPGLVVLSACETALIGGEVPDEVVSLPSGFLQSGARGVVGSFWPIYDASTALLMRHFYRVWRADDATTPAAALRAAQRWLRDTPPELALADVGARHPLRDTALGNEATREAVGREHPVHWAAFGYFGG